MLTQEIETTAVNERTTSIRVLISYVLNTLLLERKSQFITEHKNTEDPALLSREIADYSTFPKPIN